MWRKRFPRKLGRSASHIDDNELLRDHLDLIKNHESLQKLLARYMEDNKKLSNDLDSAKDKINDKQCDLNNLHMSYENLKVSHQKLDQLLVYCRSESNKLTNILEENAISSIWELSSRTSRNAFRLFKWVSSHSEPNLKISIRHLTPLGALPHDTQVPRQHHHLFPHKPSFYQNLQRGPKLAQD